MSEFQARRFHQLYSVLAPRISYQAKDCVDYVFMTLITAVIIFVAYGPNNPLTALGIGLCAAMAIGFPIRHGTQLRVPVIVRRPQDLLYMLLYKVRNITPAFVIAATVVLVENVIISMTPALPHHSDALRSIAIGLFYLHFALISVYRTSILIAHLRSEARVKEVLLQTSWKSAFRNNRGARLEIVHAYLTGLLTHLVLVAPWYVAITHLRYSLLLLPLICIINALIHFKHIRSYSAWFYRDHWLGHNSEFEFIYLHGSHHDAIPSGLIGVSGNGYLEGFVRHTIGVPGALFSPLMAVILYTFEIYQDINNHQYIPGIFPRLPRSFHETCQHSTHHYGRLEPYSIALKFDLPPNSSETKRRFKLVPDEVLDSIRLDEDLSGFKWDNPRYRNFLRLFDTYEK